MEKSPLITMSPQDVAFGFPADGRVRASPDLGPGSVPSLVNVLNTLHRNMVNSDITGRVGVKRARASHPTTATTTVTSNKRLESRSTSRRLSQASSDQEHEPPTYIKEDEARSNRSSTSSRAPSLPKGPDLPSWTSLPAAEESSTDYSTDHSEITTVHEAPMKIGPPRNAKRVRKPSATPQTSKSDEIQKEKSVTSTPSTSKTPPVAVSTSDSVLPSTPPPPPSSVKASSKFIGVVITKPSPRKAKPSVDKGNEDLVSALTRAFENDKDALKIAEQHVLQRTSTSTSQPAGIMRRPRITLGAVVPLRPVDIDSQLGTRVAPLHIPRPDGLRLADPAEWERTMYGEASLRRLRVSLRHVEESLEKVEGKVDVDVGPRVFAVPEKSRMRFFVERLNETFGPGSIHRGAGPKPKVDQKVDNDNGERAGVGVRTRTARSGGNTSVSDSEGGWSDLMEKVLLGKRTRSVSLDSEEETGMEPPRRKVKMEPIGVETMNEWTGALQKLIKGKTTMGQEELQALGLILDKIEEVKEILEPQDLKESRVMDAVTDLSTLNEIPFDDQTGLRSKASRLVQFWKIT